MGEPPILAQRFERIQCSLSIALPSGAHVDLVNQFGSFMLAISQRDANFAEFVPASITLGSVNGTLILPARPLEGGTVFAPLSEASDPGNRLRPIISAPFRLTAQVAGSPVFDAQLPAVPEQARQAQGICLMTDYKVMHGQATVTHDAAGRTLYTIKQ